MRENHTARGDNQSGNPDTKVILGRGVKYTDRRGRGQNKGDDQYGSLDGLRYPQVAREHTGPGLQTNSHGRGTDGDKNGGQEITRNQSRQSIDTMGQNTVGSSGQEKHRPETTPKRTNSHTGEAHGEKGKKKNS